MKKSIMKFTAIVLAGAIMVSGMGSTCADAAVGKSASWKIKHMNISGMPSSESRVNDTCAILYSTKGADAYCTSASHSVNGGSGKTRVNCASFPMTQRTITNIGFVHCSPTVSGVITYVYYSFSANTSTSNNTFNASGNIVATE